MFIVPLEFSDNKEQAGQFMKGRAPIDLPG